MPSPEVVTLPVGLAVRRGTAQLTEGGCDTPRLDAELLLAEALGVSRERLVLDAREPVPAVAQSAYASLIARRRDREPVAYILGRRGFRQLELRCDRRALIPRPETELLVEVGLGLPAGARVLDVGTGTGAVALALAHERPDLRVTGVDVSPDAVALARENARRLGLEVELRCGDLRDGIACDALLANLPYVATDGAELPPELGYEPPGALYAGPDGLDVIRRLAGQLDGIDLVALEHGSGQAAAVGALLEQAGYGSVEVLRDLAGHERVTLGRR